MRNGKNILRMQADEEDVYHLMDLRERYFVLIGAGSLIEGIAAYFLFFQIRCWDLIYLCAALFLGIFLLLRQSNKISKRIMEAETKCGTVKWFSAKKGYGFVTGEDGEDYFAHFSQIKMEGFKMLSGKQPVQFEVGTDENGRALAMNILPLSVEEEA